jgi:DnaJ-class molecular chaperone
MADHYTILGVTKTALDSEIKAAFRKLAKIYHPDKNPNNPNASSVFQQILKAYNTLINPHARRRYDDSHFGTRTQSTTSRQPQQRHGKTQKEWTFTEEDLKRRDYYKNYYKHAEKTVAKTTPKPTYSDYKYILFATPLAVGLLMLVVSMFTNEPTTNQPKQKSQLKTDTIKK